MTVGYLADRREFIPTVARWHHTEWGHLRPGETVEDRAVRVERDCGHREIVLSDFWAAFAAMFFVSIISGLLQIINMRP